MGCCGGWRREGTGDWGLCDSIHTWHLWVLLSRVAARLSTFAARRSSRHPQRQFSPLAPSPPLSLSSASSPSHPTPLCQPGHRSRSLSHKKGREAEKVKSSRAPSLPRQFPPAGPPSLHASTHASIVYPLPSDAPLRTSTSAGRKDRETTNPLLRIAARAVASSQAGQSPPLSALPSLYPPLSTLYSPLSTLYSVLARPSPSFSLSH